MRVKNESLGALQRDGLHRLQSRETRLPSGFLGHRQKVRRDMDLRRSRMGSLETHDARTLRFHLGEPTVPAVYESTHDGEDPQELGTGRQHRQEDAGNHLLTRPQSVAHGEPANRSPQNKGGGRGLPVERRLLLQVLGRRKMDLQETDSSLGGPPHLCAKTTVLTQVSVPLERSNGEASDLRAAIQP